MLNKIIQKLKNPYTVVSIVTSLIVIFQTLDLTVNGDKVQTITNSVCAIFVILGIMNNPDTEGLS